eukprot:gene28841-32030_t
MHGPVPCMGLWPVGSRLGIPVWLPSTQIAKHLAQNLPTTIICPFESFVTLERKDVARESGAQEPPQALASGIWPRRAAQRKLQDQAVGGAVKEA